MSRQRVTPLAIALAVGIALGSWVGSGRGIVWPWAVSGAIALAGASVARVVCRRDAVSHGLIAVAAVCLGAMWLDLRRHTVTPDDLAAWLGGEPWLVRVRGTALEPPVLRDRAAGSMAVFGHRPPATYFDLRVTALLERDGTTVPVSGTVLVRVGETVAPFRAGDRVEALGMLHPPAPPGNPGELDYRRHARSRGRAGTLSVPRRDLLVIAHARRGALAGAWPRLRHDLRRRAQSWLLSDLPDADRRPRDALLSALLLGRRGPQLDGVGESFRRAGLAHFLAISGLHLGVMAGFVLFLTRLGGRHRRWHGWLVIAVVATYLVVVEVRMPVLRAGIMTMAACLGLAAGRRLRVGGLVSASGIGLLLWRPDELFTPGFQLSYGVVLGLIHLAPLVRARCFGRPDAFAASSAEMVGQWLRTACAAALTAWAVATPISLHHWGVLWPLAAPFSVIVLPLVAAVLAVGYVKMVLAALLPSAALLLAVPLALGADVLLAVVAAMDAVPGSIIHVAHAPAAWSLAAIAWVCMWAVLGGRIWGFWGTRRGRWTIRLAGFALVAWLSWPLLAPQPAALRVDMLAVGDGSCYLLRSGASNVIFDAGSSNLDAGRRLVVPALRRLGLRRIDALVISHPNLDHYSAVLEIVDAFAVTTILVTPQLIRDGESEPAGPVRYLLDELTRRMVPVRSVAAGDRRQYGSCRWTWLHPGRAAVFDEVNDGSMVIRIDVAGRSVLLCGDIQQQAMETLGASALLSAPGAGPAAIDVLELAHHGSHHARAESFVGALEPRVVLQSTGPTRWRRTRDDWDRVLRGAERLVTARDGACRVEIDRDGTLRIDRFRDPPR